MVQNPTVVNSIKRQPHTKTVWKGKAMQKKRIHLNVRDNEIHKLIEVYIHKRTVSMQVKFEEYKLKK